MLKWVDDMRMRYWVGGMPSAFRKHLQNFLSSEKESLSAISLILRFAVESSILECSIF